MDKMNIIAHTKPWVDRFPLTGRYTYGIAGERFFREIKDHARFTGTRCPNCDLVYVPPRLYCERCFAHLEEWVDVGSVGTVATFTVLHLDLDENPLPEPQILALVELDGADGGLVHFLGEVDPEDVYTGMPVEAVFKPAEERVGAITDIQYFRPAR